MFRNIWEFIRDNLIASIMAFCVFVWIIFRAFSITPITLPDLDSVTFGFERNEKELALLQKDMKDVKRRLREIEWTIDEKVGDVVFSIAHSPIKELKLPDNSAIVPPIK